MMIRNDGGWWTGRTCRQLRVVVLILAATVVWWSPVATFTTTTRRRRRRCECNTMMMMKQDINNDDSDDDVRSASELSTTTTFRSKYHEVLPTWLLDKCEECGYIYPTRIQEEVLDALLLLPSSTTTTEKTNHHHHHHNKNLIVQSATGSGKTLAFVVPILAHVDASRSTIQALIVVPSRELGLQIARVAKRLAAPPLPRHHQNHKNNNNHHNHHKIMIMSVLQGSQNRRQRAWAWAEPPHIIIGTPTELCTMIQSGGIKRYNSIKYVIVDEVDACLSLNKNQASLSSSASATWSSQFTGTPLHELLSKYLSPTYDDGKEDEEEGNVSAATTTSSSSSPRPMSSDRTTLFCSATIPQRRYFAKQCVQNQWMLQAPEYLSVGPTNAQPPLLPAQLRHSYVVSAAPDQKLATLRRLLRTLQKRRATTTTTVPRVVVFADPHRPLEEMAQVIAKDLHGFYCNERTISSSSLSLPSPTCVVSVLRYEDSLSQRALAMEALRGEEERRGRTSRLVNHPTAMDDPDNNDDDDDDDSSFPSSGRSQNHTAVLRILLSTDLAARGLDVVDITHIVHFDCPDSAEAYVHRSGRTGRLNRSGRVISIITPEQEFVLQRIVNQLQLEMTTSSDGRPTTKTT